MAQEDYGATQELPKANGKLFQGVRALVSGVGKFVANAGVNIRTEAGNLVADLSTHVTTDSGAGATLGTPGDAAASSDSNSASVVSLTKRGLGHLQSIVSAVTSAASGIGAAADAEAAPGGVGSLSGKLRNIAINLYNLLEGLGGVNDDAAATDTGAYGLIPFMKRLLAKLTTQLPASLGRKAATAALPVVLSDEDLAAISRRASSSTLANVAASASVGTLQASNANRLGLEIYNDADRALYVKKGSAASLTSFTVKIEPRGYWSMDPPVYTGIVTGLWDASPTGNARVTES